MVNANRPDGPWLQAALFCSEVAKNERGLYSFSGIHDGVLTDGAPGSHTDPFMALAFTGGETPRTAALRIVARDASGSAENVIFPQILRFDGPRRGHTMVSQIRISTEVEGTVWFDILIDGELVTGMPFHIVFSGDVR